MLGTKIQALRKKKGYSQEVLAGKLNVVRQTISKWEKELSVPDAEMLKNIAEVFEVPVSELLDGKMPEQDGKADIEAVAQQLEILNEQYAARNGRREKLIRKIGAAIGILVLLGVLGAVLPHWMDMFHDFGGNLYHMIHG